MVLSFIVLKPHKTPEDYWKYPPENLVTHLVEMLRICTLKAFRQNKWFDFEVAMYYCPNFGDKISLMRMEINRRPEMFVVGIKSKRTVNTYLGEHNSRRKIWVCCILQ
ncbi:hypothetical protein NPIL_129831 [Nephila pilipes]|uniref:Uncharacterized protein n=1 Tax=Nephila pilipes TaxID=299642 RepID=A0A8X6IUE4_NEPPI|nr:hypothetical protein NPIL_129831 [Nephila pilipes]